MSDTDTLAARISRENLRGMAVSRSASLAAEILFGNRPESTRLIRNLLAEFPSFAGGSVCYTVNADFNDSRTDTGLKNLRDGRDAYADGGIDAFGLGSNRTSASIDEWIAKGDGGRFLSYWTRRGGELFIEPLAASDASEYSAGLRMRLEDAERESLIVSEPHLYNGKVLMAEYSSPVAYDGKFSGQTVFAVDLSNLSATLSTPQASEGEEVFLVSSRARVISSTKYDNLRTVSIDDLYTDENGNFITNFLRDDNGRLVRDELLASNTDLSGANTMYRDLLKSAFNTAKNSALVDNFERKILYFKDPRSRSVYCVYYSVVRPGDWVLVHFIPRTAMLAPATACAYANLAGLALFAAVAAAALLLSRSPLKRVAAVANFVDDVARGRMGAASPLPPQRRASGDETRRLVRSASFMARKLSNLLDAVGDCRVSLRAASESIAASASDCSLAVCGLSESSESVKSATKRASDGCGELCGFLETLRDSAAETAELAELERGNLGAASQSAAEISAGAVLVARRLSTVNDRANGIGAAAAAVSKIAYEANLLSFNASIEAGKAGSYGVGFSVVAREIGRLAERISGAAADIETAVRDLRGVVEAETSEMDKFSGKVSESVAGVESALSSMNSLAERVQALVPGLDELNSAIRSHRERVGDADTAAISLVSEVRKCSGLPDEIGAGGGKLDSALKKLESEISDFLADGEGRGGS